MEIEVQVMGKESNYVPLRTTCSRCDKEYFPTALSIRQAFPDMAGQVRWCDQCGHS